MSRIEDDDEVVDITQLTEINTLTLRIGIPKMLCGALLRGRDSLDLDT